MGAIIIEDQGKYFGRLGTHKITLKDGSVMYMRRQPGNEAINLYKFCGSDNVRRFSVGGQVKIEQGLWSHNQGLVLEVTHIQALFHQNLNRLFFQWQDDPQKNIKNDSPAATKNKENKKKS